MNVLSRVVLGSLLLSLAVSAAQAQSQYAHLALGNPSQAGESADNFLIRKEYFALSYNNSKGTPNWVSWHLTHEEIGSAKRLPFYPDLDLPTGFNHIVPKDYTSSGFDRGHMCPHSDRDRTEAMSHATFVMTNIIPQAPAVNQKAWRQLEMYCRMLVERQHKELYIICGPAGEGGRGREGVKNTLAHGKVTVPAECWKVILVLEEADGDDAARIDANARMIAVVMPNDERVGEDWTPYRTSVRQVEQLTGYQFFDRVPEALVGPLKESVDHYKVALGPSVRQE
jgi:endonuclease G